MAGYRVNLDIFAGPLDLLLYLVRKDEVDIYDIPIAGVTEQYIKYIEMLKQLDIDLASEFLVMASTLVEIKSAMLLPRVPAEQLGSEEILDPRAELVRQLLEYKKFKDTANLLGSSALEHSLRFNRPNTIIDKLEPNVDQGKVDIEQITIWNLLDAFDSLMKAVGSLDPLGHIKDDTPIDLYQIDILNRLQDEGAMSFESLFVDKSNRLVLVGMFLALLELIRSRLVWFEQPGPFSSIYLRALTDEPAEEAVKKAITAVADIPAQPAKDIKPTIPIVELPTEKPGRDSEQSQKIRENQNHSEI